MKREFLHAVEWVQGTPCIQLVLGLGIWDVPAGSAGGGKRIPFFPGSRQSSRISKPPRLTQGREQPCPAGILLSLVLEREPVEPPGGMDGIPSHMDQELLDLFIQWDWSTYLADYGQPTCKYLRVNPTTALILLEKMRDTSRKNNVFAQFRKNERDKQKLIDTVAKQLRGLINSHHS
ncbi:hypothetical protein DUI87_22111 [Hirundo rustica rustica]|uniref:Exocyst complex component 6 n=1 Tax=Hirundo rustica rustica TaxID=333673 RepID=A0A3M0JJM6_HIRRU|nr:hypothetical protein DUI87_22111 [Hirundo rustica rustica]